MAERGLQFIKCECSENPFLVGVNGKDIRKSEGSSGDFGGAPYLALGSDELGKAPKLPEKIECPNCGREVKVQEAEPVEE